jgi:isopenicillin N synthase-like dioxygenase
VVDDSSAILRLGQSLFPLFALALDLPETFFDDKVSLNPQATPRGCLS